MVVFWNKLHKCESLKVVTRASYINVNTRVYTMGHGPWSRRVVELMAMQANLWRTKTTLSNTKNLKVCGVQMKCMDVFVHVRARLYLCVFVCACNGVLIFARQLCVTIFPCATFASSQHLQQTWLWFVYIHIITSSSFYFICQLIWKGGCFCVSLKYVRVRNVIQSLVMHSHTHIAIG